MAVRGASRHGSVLHDVVEMRRTIGEPQQRARDAARAREACVFQYGGFPTSPGDTVAKPQREDDPLPVGPHAEVRLACLDALRGQQHARPPALRRRWVAEGDPIRRNLLHRIATPDRTGAGRSVKFPTTARTSAPSPITPDEIRDIMDARIRVTP